jgi:hypothetical protein
VCCGLKPGFQQGMSQGFGIYRLAPEQSASYQDYAKSKSVATAKSGAMFLFVVIFHYCIANCRQRRCSQWRDYVVGAASRVDLASVEGLGLARASWLHVFVGVY